MMTRNATVGIALSGIAAHGWKPRLACFRPKERGQELENNERRIQGGKKKAGRRVHGALPTYTASHKGGGGARITWSSFLFGGRWLACARDKLRGLDLPLCLLPLIVASTVVLHTCTFGASKASILPTLGRGVLSPADVIPRGYLQYLPYLTVKYLGSR
ncbi:hypothetical protein LY76DRAFT_337287 [Colletotrichum caudatum]|nr:hypothetical protein LY76DRAFT_337287 [Colletotrichum caudatum]